MSDFNTQHDRVVWFDLPVVDLDGAGTFYPAVLGVKVHKDGGRGYCGARLSALAILPIASYSASM